MSTPVLAEPALTHDERRRTTPADLATWALTAAAVVAGAVMRAWYLAHRPLSSDEAVAGLMARQILHGHVWTFYWGQAYGGAEPYVTAAAFEVFGSSAWVLRAVPVALAGVAAILTWRVTRRLVADPALAILAGALVWAVPDSAVANSFIEWGFRGVTLACGVGMLLVALRILDGKRRWREYAGLGLISGVGWWSSPEIVYFALPAALVLAGAATQEWRTGRGRQLAAGLAAGAAGVAVGALPWLWTNAHNGLQSLSTSAFGAPAGSAGYRGRLDNFFHFSVGILFSVRSLFTGAWLGGKAVGTVLLVILLAALAAALAVSLARRGRSAVMAIAVGAFPFLLAESPATWLWQGGRYIGYIVPLYVMVLAIGAEGVRRAHATHRSAAISHLRRTTAGRTRLVAVSALLLATTLVSFGRNPTPGFSFRAGWGDPNAPTTPTIRLLEASGVSEGYAGYWIAYRLDFLSHDRLQLTVGRGESVRWSELDRKVAANGLAAWIFVKPTETAGLQFGHFGGPAGLPQATFVAALRRAGVGYRIVDADLVQAVIPTRPVDAAAIYAHP